MDIETRRMHRRAVAVAAAATIVVVLGQHAALRARMDSLSSDRQPLGEAGPAAPIHSRGWGLIGGVKDSRRRAAVRAKRGGERPADAHAAAPQLARWDGMNPRD